jgi:hypothetical protein
MAQNIVKIVYLTWMQKFFDNELGPFEGVPATVGLEPWLQSNVC